MKAKDIKLDIKITNWHPEGLNELLTKGTNMLKAGDRCPNRKCNTLLIQPEIDRNHCAYCNTEINKGETKVMDSAKMSAVLPNGVKLEGPVKAVQELLRANGVFVPDGVHYKSSHDGIIKIQEMTTRHIMNAIRKMYRTWTNELNADTLSFVDFREKLRKGPTEDITLLALVNELNKRMR